MRRRHGYRHATRDGLGSTRVSCREAAAPHTEGRKCKMVAVGVSQPEGGYTVTVSCCLKCSKR